MGNINKLTPDKLKVECNSKVFEFTDTSKLEPLQGLIGQDRAVKSMEFGLKIKTRGYNLYLSGQIGTGKTSYAQGYVKSLAEKEKIPDDWCYVYNFDKPNQPIALNMPAGMGVVFQKDLDEFIKIIKMELKKAFESEDYEREKSEISKNFLVKKDELIEKLNEDAKEQGFVVKTTNSGIYFLPIVEGKTISEDEFGDLADDVKHEISKKSDVIQRETMDIIRKIKNIDKESEEKIKVWENKIALFAVGMQTNDLKEKYNGYDKISEYLDKLQINIFTNLDEFRDEEVPEDQQQVLLPWLMKNMDSTEKYRVNLLVDNGSLKGAPVISDYNPTFYNLMGKLDYENEFGSMTTDFTMIKAGQLHYANGGYLIIQAKDILSNYQSWEGLKRVLRTGEVSIGCVKEELGLVQVSAIKPEPIPVELKVIIIGNSYLYQMLLDYDEDFKKLFKVKVDFDDEMDRNEENIKKMAQFISSYCVNEQLLHFEKTGAAKIIDYSSRLIENQKKMSTKFNDIVEIISESSAWAEIEKSKKVRAKHVKKAIEEKVYRSNKYDEKLQEYLNEGRIIVTTKGEKVGQINGLSILDMGDYSFGKPNRITANTFIGERGIVNIEREVEMSGTSHSKGVLILSGYIGYKYAQDIPLTLTASLCFEQMYGGIDGDSASSAELYAVLSSLSELPIKQGIAVTGSVNQKGEIQPVGGVTEKIEGFFALCSAKGLNGEQGVIIPQQNEINLVLNDNVIDAVKKGKFHIYSVKTIDDGIEILTGVKVGKKSKQGNYEKGSINYLVYEKLKKYAKIVTNCGKDKK
ncbi:MAG: ATP-binding protein [Clostridiales bacterium]